jgi:uncharacterized protein involved in outer membrane biogenesis
VCTRRTILIGAAAAVAAVALVAVLMYERLDSIVRRAIEERGSAITQTAVRVKSVAVSLRDGSATLEGLTIANPEGFSAPNVFELGEISARIDVGSAFSDPLVIREIRIAAARVTCELNAAGTSNVEVIRQAAEGAGRRGEPRAGPASPGDAGERAPSASGRRLIIDRLTLQDGAVSVDARAVGGPEQSESLPGFELTDIGAKQGGVTPAEAGRVIVTALARDVAVAVAATQLERYIGKALGGRASDALKKGGTEAIEKGLGDVLDKLLRPKDAQN